MAARSRADRVAPQGDSSTGRVASRRASAEAATGARSPVSRSRAQEAMCRSPRWTPTATSSNQARRDRLPGNKCWPAPTSRPWSSLRDRRGASIGAQLGRCLRRQRGTRAGRTRADHRQDDLGPIGGVPTAGRVDDALCGGRPVRRRRGLYRHQCGLPRLPVPDDPQRASATGLQQPRCQGPDARGAAPCDVVSSSCRAGSSRHRVGV